MQYLPLIKCFSSEAITEEDWKEIAEVASLGEMARDDITVEKIIAHDIQKYLEEIEEITMKAEKKFSLSKKLKLMKEEMKIFTLTLFPYKKTSVLKGYDDINAKLDD
jgi:dynein heavy chain